MFDKIVDKARLKFYIASVLKAWGRAQ